MEKIEVHTGRIVPVDASDVDTDQIIPAVWMKRVERSGFEDGLFQKWRRDPDFVLNQPERAGADVLVSGPNFGCGSSREHAPWALRDYGFKAVIAPSFADIFRNNLPNVGLVPVTLDPASTRRILDAATADAAVEVTIDLHALTVRCAAAGVEAPFQLDENARYRLTNGKDLIDLALDLEDRITAHERYRQFWMPTASGVVEASFQESGVE